MATAQEAAVDRARSEMAASKSNKPLPKSPTKNPSTLRLPGPPVNGHSTTSEREQQQQQQQRDRHAGKQERRERAESRAGTKADKSPRPDRPVRSGSEGDRVRDRDRPFLRDRPLERAKSASPLPTPPPKTTHRREPSAWSTYSLSSSDNDSVVRDFRLAQAAYDRLSSNAPLRPVSEHTNQKKSVPPSAQFPKALSPLPKDAELQRTRSAVSLTGARSSGSSPQPDDDALMAMYLRSPQLNKILALPRPFPDRPLQVSLADLGKPDGKPVVVFLGLGCVRYLIALYDDLARAFGLRLICIDRWGLGKTDQVPQNQRGPMDWADVVRRVLDQLGVNKFQIVAHSAGAPYAMATVLRLGDRVVGRPHLLAPWVGGDVEGYKWLKWVPNGVIKSALAAEWRLESYFLGKAPSLKALNKAGIPTSPSLDGESLRSLSSNVSSPIYNNFASLPLSTSSVHVPASMSEDSLLVTSSPTFLTALMQASHAESLSGTTADLLSVILGRDTKPWGFSFTDVKRACKIFWGTLDDKVSEKSMRWMERSMDAELVTLKDEGHNLMSSRGVMYDVLDSLANDEMVGR